MPKVTSRLTDREIKNTPIREKEYILADGNGLNIRIRPNGTKSWQFRYSDPVTKKIKKISLGSYPKLGLADARKFAQEHRNSVSNGIDPKEILKENKLEAIRKESNSLHQVAEQWFSRKKKGISTAHADRIWRSLEKYVFPKLGSVAIENVTRKEAIQTLRPLETAQKLSTIKRICQSLNQIMEYGVDTDALSANPLTKMLNAFEAHQTEHMPTISPDMIGDFLKELHSNNTIQNKTRYLILWQLHTITRPKEAARTRWCDIDFSNMCWTIPASEMKRRRKHRVPLTNESLKILELMRPYSEGKEYVFPSQQSNSPHVSVFTANAALKRSLGYKNKLVAHGLRAIASTALHEHGFNTLYIEACLSHVDQNETRASYNRSDFFEQRKEIMRWWSEYIEKAYKSGW